MILGEDTVPRKSLPPTEATQPESEEGIEVTSESQAGEQPTTDAEGEPKKQSKRKEPRRGTIFVPAEGIFRTLSQQELEAMEQNGENEATLEPPTPADSEPNHPRYARTPSVEPPSFALMAQERTSLLSLLNAPRESEANLAFNIPSTRADFSYVADDVDTDAASATGEEQEEESDSSPDNTSPSQVETPTDTRPHTSAAFYTVTTTTSIPIQDDNVKPAPRSAPLPLTHMRDRTPSFDVNNPALTPTMTREQALAQIRERRGRARSAMQGAMTPRRQMVTGVTGDRNVSAPAGRAAKGRS